MATRKVKINRAPVLTLWAAVVAGRVGYDPDAALSLGKAVAGLNAQSKGRRLGIFQEPSDQDKAKRKSKTPEATIVTLLGRPVPTVHTKQGIRAAIQDETIDPKPVKEYLEKKFGEDLGDVRTAMEALAKSYEPDELTAQAFGLYEKFRPQIPEGKRGWGAAGELDLGQLQQLARRRK